jgi:hypothetical protein
MTSLRPEYPPKEAVDRAVEAANASPCGKSKRGVCAFERYYSGVGPSVGLIWASHNGPPIGIPCYLVAGGNLLLADRCRNDCAKRCVHAEARALREAVRYVGASYPKTTMQMIELVHVKTDNGTIVAGGGPSCWACSKEIADADIAGVWLYENVLREARHGRGDGTVVPMWRFYTSADFHRATVLASELC